MFIFAYIIAMAVIGMAYGGNPKTSKGNDQDLFFIEYMISIILIPVSSTLLTLALKNKL